MATNMTFSLLRFWLIEFRRERNFLSSWSYRLPKVMEHMMLEIQTLIKECMLNGSPFFDWISWTKTSISSIILVSKLRFPNPNSLSVFKEKVLCSFHSAPEEVATPTMNRKLKKEIDYWKGISFAFILKWNESHAFELLLSNHIDSQHATYSLSPLIKCDIDQDFRSLCSVALQHYMALLCSKYQYFSYCQKCFSPSLSFCHGRLVIQLIKWQNAALSIILFTVKEEHTQAPIKLIFRFLS